MTLDCIETLKTFIYSPKHTQNTNIYFISFKLSQSTFSKSSKIIVLYANVYGIISILC